MRANRAAMAAMLCTAMWVDAEEKDATASYDTLMKAGHELNAKKEANGAEKQFKSALRMAPDASAAARARNQIAAILKSKGKDKAAEARALLETSLTTEGVDEGVKAEAQYLLAQSWIDTSDWPQARKAWAKLLHMPGVWPAALSEARMIVGAGLVEEKKFDEARQILEKCIAAEDGIAWQKCEAQMSIAKSFVGENRQPEAKAALAKLLGMESVNDDLKKQAEELLKSLK